MLDLDELQRLIDACDEPHYLVADADTAKKLIAVARAARTMYLSSTGDDDRVAASAALRTALEELK